MFNVAMPLFLAKRSITLDCISSYMIGQLSYGSIASTFARAMQKPFPYSLSVRK